MHTTATRRRASAGANSVDGRALVDWWLRVGCASQLEAAKIYGRITLEDAIASSGSPTRPFRDHRRETVASIHVEAVLQAGDGEQAPHVRRHTGQL